MAKKSFKDSLNKTNIGDLPVGGIKAVFSSTAAKETEQEGATVLTAKGTKPEVQQENAAYDLDTRQTFVISESDLEKLKDFIYLRKITVNPYFNQKEALHQALELLFAQVQEIPERPGYIKKMEKSKTAKIKRKLS